MVKNYKYLCFVFLSGLLLIGACIQQNELTLITKATVKGCYQEHYPEPGTSKYILPYQIGKSYVMNHGNCGSFTTHRPRCAGISDNGNIIECGDLRYAYDFSMPVGAVVVASRTGQVIKIEDTISNKTNSGAGNYVSILHDDETIAAYVHLSPNSVLVSVGERVNQGQAIAKSGSSGLTDAAGYRNPHLHFHVLTPPYIDCGDGIYSGCRSIPVTFKNALPADSPLIEGNAYKASEIQ